MINELTEWFAHIQLPKSELSNLPICPYAKAAILAREFTISECTVDSISEQISTADIETIKVHIFYLSDYSKYTIEHLQDKTKTLNSIFIKNDKVILDNDPRDPLIINGVTTTFSHCYLWIVQSLSDLNAKSTHLMSTNYYSYWSQQQLDDVVTWRTKNL
jgi:hypothetical protein